MGALSLSLWSMRARVRSSGRNAHIRSSTVVYVIKNNDRKKLSETCTNPEVRFLAQKYSVVRPKFFFETLSMLSMRIQLFNSVNNSECMKQHCTPPLKENCFLPLLYQIMFETVTSKLRYTVMFSLIVCILLLLSKNSLLLNLKRDLIAALM